MIKKLKAEQQYKLTLLGQQVLLFSSISTDYVTNVFFFFCLQYEQSISDMLQKQSLRLDESQEMEGQQLRDRLQYELDILMAYQSKNRINAQTQRDRERKELVDRVSVRRALLENKVNTHNLIKEK